ncbi:MAG: 5-formyltetrahydrofolate cyclo-ligase [Actinomycetota bacterium]
MPKELERDKAALRARMRALRSSIPPGERGRLAGAVRDRLFELDAVRKARTILLFYSFGSEIPTKDMAQRLIGEGRRVLLPFLQGREMAVGELLAGEPLAATSYGPKEPVNRPPVDPGEVDLAIAPGLAFDRSGHRIGYGGGHYDRYLARLQDDATRVGIAYHVQLLAAVPHGPDDEPLDFVVTDRETIACRRRGRSR